MKRDIGFDKVCESIYVGIFLLLLLVPLFFTNTKEGAISELDNRVLVEFPEIGSENFESGIESYLQDRIGFRDCFVTGYQMLNDKVADELTHPIYTYGQDGYTFYGMHDNIDYGEFHQTFADSVIKMRDYCNARGVPFYFMFDPEKISVYRRYLPPGVNYSDQWVDELLEYLTSNEVIVVNNKDLLIDKSYSEQVFNRQYDAGHWNDLGCFYGTNNLWRTVHSDFPEVDEYTLSDFDIGTSIGEYLAASKFPVNEKIPVFTPKYKWQDISNKYVDIEKNKSYPFFAYYKNISADANELPKMLVFHGSYYNRGPKFFIGRASEYIGVHDYQNVLDLPYYFNIFQPDMVVFEVAEYTFTDQYFSYQKMKNIDFNPVLDVESDEVTNACKLLLPDYCKVYEVNDKPLDNYYLNCPLADDMRYVYLTDEINTFDMKLNDYGKYSATVTSGCLNRDNIKIFFKDQKGDIYYFEPEIVKAVNYFKDKNRISLSEGCGIDEINSQITMTTDLKENRFSYVVLQKYDAETGAHVGDISVADAADSVIGEFVHEEESGWYTICLKANSNIKDESVNVSAFLSKGERYFYKFTVNSLKQDEVIISDYEFIGAAE